MMFFGKMLKFLHLCSNICLTFKKNIKKIRMLEDSSLNLLGFQGALRPFSILFWYSFMKKLNSVCLFKLLILKKIFSELCLTLKMLNKLLSLLEVEPENDKNSINFFS